MNEKLETPGLVIREKPAKEANSLLTILTATQGVVLATAYGARKPGATLSSGTKLFNYSNFTLLESRGRYKVDSAQPIETFFGLSHSIEALTAASYFAEVLYDVCVTGQSDTQALRHIVSAPMEKLFSFALGDESLSILSALCERYLLTQTGRSYETLSMYHSLVDGV